MGYADEPLRQQQDTAAQIYASRPTATAPAHGHSARAIRDVDITGLSSGQLLSVQGEEFSELGNIDQTSI